MQRLDITGDAQRALDTLQNGGVVLIPHACGYGLFGGTEESTNRIFSTKQRAGHKRNTMLCDIETQREVHDVDRRAQEMIEAIAVDYDLPLCAVGPYRADHPLLKNILPRTCSKAAPPTGQSACTSMRVFFLPNSASLLARPIESCSGLRPT